MICCLLVHGLLLTGPWFGACRSMICCLLVHDLLLTGPWFVAYMFYFKDDLLLFYEAY
jgi:hypothetical protein